MPGTPRPSRFPRLAAGAFCVALTLGAAAAAQPAQQGYPSGSVFAMPDYVARQTGLTLAVLKLFQEHDYAAAEKALRDLVAKYPDWSVHRYNLAAALARQGQTEAALDSLAEAIERGFSDLRTLGADPDLDSLRQSPRFRHMLTELEAAHAAKTSDAPPVPPAQIEDGRALVGEANTFWQPRGNLLVSLFDFPEAPTVQRVMNRRDDRVARRLNTWFLQGKAAGNHGDLYDNRDRGHSLLSGDLFPQLARIAYGDGARDAGLDYGVNARLLYNAITLGNSSTAITSRVWRSQPRLAMTTAGLPQWLFLQYASDMVYVYPEHRDHDPERGDLFPANTPYMLVSQGSSHSDRPLLEAVAAILAALRPETKAFLRARHLVMPTVQMVFRSGLKQVAGKADYMSAKAHPSAFEAADIDLVKMITTANELTPDTVPPRVDLVAIDRTRARVGRELFAPVELGETLFETPNAIARIVRSTAYETRLVVSAAATKDPNDRPLSFHWVVLRGDAARIGIVPRNAEGSVVELVVPWHERRPVPGRAELTTDRVDIAVFADNGAHVSAPSFVSFMFPADQRRQYDTAGRPLRIAYDDPERAGRYVDPVLFPARDWTDTYDYDDAGRLLGWTRARGSDTERLTRNGERVLAADEQGRPTRAERVRYALENVGQPPARIVEQPTGQLIAYRYEGPDDRFGKAEEVSGN